MPLQTLMKKVYVSTIYFNTACTHIVLYHIWNYAANILHTLRAIFPAINYVPFKRLAE
jgi:hypothetical protein